MQTQPQTGATPQMTLTCEFHLGAPPPRVWTALTHPEDWPRWWRYVKRVDLLETGGEHDIGAVRRLRWSSHLPYGFTLTVRTIIVAEPHVLIGDASGDLSGQGRWDLAPTAMGTRVRYTWSVHLEKPWMRRLAPLLGPVFAWNHHAVMREGARGLARELGVELFGYRKVENADGVGAALGADQSTPSKPVDIC